jgi:predicted transcriptional regulator
MMSLTITVPDEVADSVQEISRRSGRTAERILLDALRAHFPPIPQDLRDEFDALERASDEDLARFEQSLL